MAALSSLSQVSARFAPQTALAAAVGAAGGVLLAPASAEAWLAGALGAALGAAAAAWLGTRLVTPLGTREPSASRSGALKSRASKSPVSKSPVSLPRPNQVSSGSATQMRDRIIALVADSVPDAVVLFSDVGTIHYSNPVARDLFFEGQAPEGQNFIRLVSAAAAPLREALLGDTDRLFSVEVEGRRESYHLSRRSFVMDDEPLTLLVVKYMTREIHRREVDLLKRVLRVISHEVNNSLAPISSLMHSARMIATKHQQLDSYQRVFDTIDERASHLRTFLEGYAALARLPKPQLRDTDWAPLLGQLATLHPDVKLPPPPVQHGWIDGAQIEQVLINLIKNAREAGSPLSDIELRVASAADGSSEIDVLDRGPGFSAEAMLNALVPLYTTKPHGSGMGLALSREIAEAHRGSLDVANRPDGGAWIRVRLAGKAPLATDAARSRLTLTRG